MAETSTTITCPAGTITVRPEGSLMNQPDKILCPASPYSIRHEVGVMVGFIALFIIASVAYGIASRSESLIIDLFIWRDFLLFALTPTR